MNFGEKIRVFRLLRGLFQEELVQGSGFGRTVIIRHESEEDGEKGPRKKTIEAYSKALLVPKMALGGEVGDDRGVQDIFRPVNPYRPLLQETYNRIIADLKDLIPKLIEELKLTEAHFFNSDLGSVVSLTAKRHRLLLVLPPKESPLSVEISAVLREKFAGRLADSAISENLYVALMFDPVGALDQQGLPDGLKFHPKSRAAEIYRPPRMTTKVSIELAGDRPDMYERLQGFLTGLGESAEIKVDRPVDFRTQLPAEIEKWICKNGLSVDNAGRVVRGKGDASSA